MPPTVTGPVTETVNSFETTGGTSSGSASGGSSTSTPSIIYSTTAVLSTPSSLLPGASYAGSVQLAQSFQLLSLNSGAVPCRIQMYGTQAAQLSDAARPIDTPPPAGIAQNIICDIVLDSPPYTWNFTDLLGANGDNPTTPTTYCTVTNLGPIAAPVTVVIGFVPLAGGFAANSTGGNGSSGNTSSTINWSQVATLGSFATFASINTSAVQINGSAISVADLADSQNIAMVNATNDFTAPISAPVINVGSASGLQINSTQIASADLSDSSNLATLTGTNNFSAPISAPVVNASSATGLQINGNQIASADLSDSTNIAYLNVSNTFSAAINAPVVSVNSAAGLQVNGSQISSSTLSDASNLAYLTENNTFTGTINAPVVDIATSAGLTIAGTQLASINLLDSGNLAKLNGVNVFTNTVTAPTITATGSAANVFTGPVSAATISSTGSASNTFTGPVTSAAFTQASGSTSANTFNGSVTAASFTQSGTATNTFNGPVSAASITTSGGVTANTFTGNVAAATITCSGGVTSNTFSGNNITVTEINELAAPVDPSADVTVNRTQTWGFTGPAPGITIPAGDTVTIMSFTIDSSGTTDVFNLWASLTAVGASLYIKCGIDGTTGFGLSTYSGTPIFLGSITGLSAGNHTLNVNGYNPTGENLTIADDAAIIMIQQFCEGSGFTTAPAGRSKVNPPVIA